MRRADRVFGVLVALAVVSGIILVGLLATLLPRVEHLLLRGADDVADLVAMLVLALATLGIALGVGSLARQLRGTLRLIRTLLSRRIEPPPAVAGAARGLAIDGRLDVVDDERPFSFCYWFVRPRICLSSGLIARLDADELRAVLLHERYHLRQRDPLRLVVARYFAAGLYVVPLVEDLVERFALEKELEADHVAVGALGEVRPLASALDKLLPDADEVSLGLLAPVGQLSVTAARIDQLLDGRDVPLEISAGSIALSFGTLAAAVVLALQGVIQVQGGRAELGYALPGLVAPASLLFFAAISGVLQQLRLFVQR